MIFCNVGIAVGVAEAGVLNAAHGARDVVGRIFGPAQPAKQAACRLKEVARNADGIGLEPRHVPVAALVAVKLELEALVGGKVVVVGNELYQIAQRMACR